MNKKFLAILALPVLIIACAKETDPYVCTPANPSVNVPDSQVTQLQTYLAGKGLMGSVTRSDNDFYYKIDDAGTGILPNTCSDVTVTYEGKLTNDITFTSASEGTNPATYTLNRLIPGWQFGLQLLKKGGKITLYLPPALGYGASGSGPIPGNSILIFKISLIDVTN